MEIKFCENNLTHGTDNIITKLVDRHPNIKVVVDGCLGQCGDCASGPFAMVDNELIIAKTSDELYERLEEML